MDILYLLKNKYDNTDDWEEQSLLAGAILEIQTLREKKRVLESSYGKLPTLIEDAIDSKNKAVFTNDALIFNRTNREIQEYLKCTS